MVEFFYLYQNCSFSSGWYIIATCNSISVLGFSQVCVRFIVKWFRVTYSVMYEHGLGLSYMFFLVKIDVKPN